MGAFDKRPNLSPAPGLRLGESHRATRTFHESAQAKASQQHEQDLERLQRFLSDYADLAVTISGTAYTILARRGFVAGEETAAGGEPWLCVKMPNRVLRVYPSSVGDGLGNFIWPVYNSGGILIPATPESYFDIPVPIAPLRGWLWLECTVDDGNDLHGELVSCELKIGATPTAGFQSRTGTTVNIAICEYSMLVVGASDFTIDPKRGFAFVLRRYGPPGSFTWDVEPS